MQARHVLIAIAVLGLAACEAAPPATPCDSDSDCATGERCLPGGCVRFVCDGSSCIDGGGICQSASDCDDDVFCNGVERCEPSDDAADALGCLAAEEHPCAGACDESSDRCDTMGCADADGDGARDAACGGTDCDDTNPSVSPTATEVCDAIDRDDDCDPATFGVLDTDLDTFPDARCCNTPDDGEPICGTDCDDANPTVNPGNSEICDTLDNDCDTAIDEMAAPATWYRDVDGDGAGDAAMTIVSCTPPGGYVLISGDCDDGSSARRPGRAEICDGLDNDCNSLADDGTIPGIGDDCLTAEPGECNRGVMACTGVAGPACRRRAEPTAEVCNALDDDCDSLVDDSVAAVGTACTVPGGLGVCAPGTQVCDGAAGLRCVGRAPGSTELCTPEDESCDGNAYGPGLTCAPGSTQSCTVCGGTMTGTQACNGSCSFVAECEVPGRGPIRRSGTDPAFNFPASCSTAAPPGDSCRYCGDRSPYSSTCDCIGQRCVFSFEQNGNWDGYSIPNRRICVPSTWIYQYRGAWGAYEHYCMAGGAVRLGPGRYRVRVRTRGLIVGAGDERLVLEVWDVTTGVRRATAGAPTSGNLWEFQESEVVFDHPTGSCAMYEFRVLAPPYSDPLEVEWIEHERLTPIYLPAP